MSDVETFLELNNVRCWNISWNIFVEVFKIWINNVEQFVQ